MSGWRGTTGIAFAQLLSLFTALLLLLLLLLVLVLVLVLVLSGASSSISNWRS